jgi:CheY-like chemotaxis protein
MEEPRSPAHVMVVDDDPDTVAILARHVRREGYVAIEVTSGFECLRKLRDLPVDLILLDLMMPEKNGFQFRVEQVVDPVLAEIPVVIYSGDAEAQADGAVLGGVARLAKPVDVDNLCRQVEAILGRIAGSTDM